MTEASLRLANGHSNHDSHKYNNLNFRRPVVQLHMCAVFTITMSECPTRTCSTTCHTCSEFDAAKSNRNMNIEYEYIHVLECSHYYNLNIENLRI